MDELRTLTVVDKDGVSHGPYAVPETAVDAALDAASENPVQNKVIKAALDGKIAAPASAAAGQFLVYDGTAWTAQTVPDASGVSF